MKMKPLQIFIKQLQYWPIKTIKKKLCKNLKSGFQCWNDDSVRQASKCGRDVYVWALSAYLKGISAHFILIQQRTSLLW